jgi:phosphomannomutase
MLRKSYPNYYISKNKIELTPEIDVNYILKEITKKYKKQPINTLDGVKIEFDKEWVHLRKSNTEPIMRIYTEAKTQEAADALADKIIQLIHKIQ